MEDRREKLKAESWVLSEQEGRQRSMYLNGEAEEAAWSSVPEAWSPRGLEHRARDSHVQKPARLLQSRAGLHEWEGEVTSGHHHQVVLSGA